MEEFILSKTRIIRVKKKYFSFQEGRGQEGILSHVLKTLHWVFNFFFLMHRYRVQRFGILRRVYYIKTELSCVLYNIFFQVDIKNKHYFS